MTYELCAWTFPYCLRFDCNHRINTRGFSVVICRYMTNGSISELSKAHICSRSKKMATPAFSVLWKCTGRSPNTGEGKSPMPASPSCNRHCNNSLSRNRAWGWLLGEVKEDSKEGPLERLEESELHGIHRGGMPHGQGTSPNWVTAFTMSLVDLKGSWLFNKFRLWNTSFLLPVGTLASGLWLKVWEGVHGRWRNPAPFYVQAVLIGCGSHVPPVILLY